MSITPIENGYIVQNDGGLWSSSHYAKTKEEAIRIAKSIIDKYDG